MSKRKVHVGRHKLTGAEITKLAQARTAAASARRAAKRSKRRGPAPYICDCPQGQYARDLAWCKAKYDRDMTAEAKAARKEAQVRLGITRSVATRAAKRAA